MILYQVHRLLIVASILGDVGFTWWCVAEYNRASDADRAGWSLVENPIAWGVASTVAVLLLAVYLVYFSRNLAKLKATLSPPFRCPSCNYNLAGHEHVDQLTCPECGEAINS